ncbi:MAG: hypothetical protein H8D23_11465 [Candidatus Brocadiales bacterium]|nr:hypothetical protein [Candidatus Brocadiales bacterium]
MAITNAGLLNSGIKQKGNDDTFGFNIVTNFPNQDRFFRDNKHVAGMFEPETNSIHLNPFNKFTDEQKSAVARIEGFRGFMSVNNIVPNFELTKKQKKSLKGTGEDFENEGGKFARQTIASRILVGDESALDVTPEQRKEVDRIVAQFKANNKGAGLLGD